MMTANRILRSVLALELWEEDDVTDRRGSREKHDETVNSNSKWIWEKIIQ